MQKLVISWKVESSSSVPIDYLEGFSMKEHVYHQGKYYSDFPFLLSL